MYMSQNRACPGQEERVTSVQELCQACPLTQRQLREMFGVPYRTFSDWYAGRRTPPAYVIQMMAELIPLMEKPAPSKPDWVVLLLESLNKDASNAGVLIRELCQHAHVPQAHLSARFGIPLRTIEDWCAGRRNPPVYVAQMMIELLGRDIV